MCNPLELAYLAVAQRAGVAPHVVSFVACVMRAHPEFDVEGLSLWSQLPANDIERVVIELGGSMSADGRVS